ncbi:poly-beta-1,6-N-acetyl-D-glucosamine N-deacetylase PgaB [Wenzhouxiangella sp. XN24]|uniref:poly-beta-1,6-N-acetyl-D-glucosamine N-deacetylase PgaB n=1 Tax=Wenzhouxiangella sp. XN24 TaxID=2713569 RepID=UPI003211EB59
MAAEPAWVSVAWHDVKDDAAGHVDRDRYTVGTTQLAEQFDWLRTNGWTPVSLDDIIAARQGRRALPDKAVLLTFDDGLASLYTHVFPLLKAYGYPAVASVVSSWQERVAAGETIAYEGAERDATGFATWAQLREMAASGLVEIASHSHDLHRGVLANPQGNQQPAASSLEYLPAPGRYETEAEWRARVRDDLARSVALIEQHTGRAPRAIVWPYGEYHSEAEAVAAGLGMEVSLGLTNGRNGVHRLNGLHRLLLTGNPALAEFVANLPQIPSQRIQRAVHVDLDYVYDPDPAQQERNLDALLERVQALSITTVYLQAFADPDGDGTAAALYFPNRHLPMRADLFNRVAWQLRTRTGVEVYAWMPLLAFDLPDTDRALALSVLRAGQDGTAEPADADYRRLSPFLPSARQLVAEIYADLGRHAHFAGILFHDDAYLAADEDLAACAPAASWPGSERPIEDCRLSPAQKTAALVDFSLEVTAQARRYRPALRTARNMYARVAIDPSSEARFSQSMPAFLAAYDYTALMAMPYLEEVAGEHPAWLRMLVAQVARHPAGLDRTVFKLQAKDWRRDKWLPAEELRDHFQLLVRAGALNLAYYPDDFILGRPALEPLFQGLSIRSFPYRKEQPR